MSENLRTEQERAVSKNLARIFEGCPDPLEVKLDNFPKYARKNALKRFLSMYEIFKEVLHTKGSIVECGVFRGFSSMTWAKLSTILEPENLTRRIYGFDTFEGFPSIHDKDRSAKASPEKGQLYSDCFSELNDLVGEYDRDRYLGHLNKVKFIKGDVTRTIPRFVEENPHLIVSLLFVDLDLYEPTKVALEALLPRMPKGAIIAFDDLDNPIWPGETLGLLETIGIRNIELKRIAWDPYIGYAVLK